MWMLRALLLLSLLSACAESTHASVEHAADEPEAPNASAADAGLRVKPRLVTIELPRVVHRTLEEAEDGSVAWSAPEEIDDAITCVIERRAAYSPFEPFDAIVPPICVTTPAGELPRLSGVPANSDLTITVSKDGYLPVVRSLRVESGDVLLPSELRLELTVLFERAQADLFLPVPGHSGPARSRDADLADAGAAEAEPGRIAFEIELSALFPHVPYPDGQTLLSHGPNLTRGLLASGGQLTLAREGKRPPAQLAVEGKVMLLEVDPGSYRAQADQPRTFCEPRAHLFAYSISGLSTDAPEELELRVLPGHVSVAAFVCLCVPPSLNHIIVDDASCTFAELGAELPGTALGPDGGAVEDTAQLPDAGAPSQPD